MKRFLSVFMVFCLFITFDLPTSAINTIHDANDCEVSVVKGADSLSTQDYHIFTAFDGVKRSMDGNYAFEVTINNEVAQIPVGRLDVDLLNTEDYNNVMARSDIAPDVKNRMAELKELAIESGEVSFIVTFFSSELLPQSRTTTYYMYNGYRMRCDRLYSYNLNTGYQYVSQGINTVEVAGSAVALAIGLVGTITNIAGISIIGTGISMLQWFDQFFPEYTTGHRSDFAQIRIIYDITNQWTYAEIGGQWMLGLISESVHLDQVDTSQYYYNPNRAEGKTKDSTYYPNSTIATPNHNDPLATAFQYAYQTKNEQLKISVGNWYLEF